MEEFEQFIGARCDAGALHAEEATEDEQVLANRQLHIERLLLVHHANPGANLGAMQIWVLPKDLEGARGAR